MKFALIAIVAGLAKANCDVYNYSTYYYNYYPCGNYQCCWNNMCIDERDSKCSGSERQAWSIFGWVWLAAIAFCMFCCLKCIEKTSHHHVEQQEAYRRVTDDGPLVYIQP